ncbi:MAG: glycine zipper domain-containing protein [Syntrophales bacterium]|nr:glycine zipper domain-containing protein [Syntrophales bacterium]
MARRLLAIAMVLILGVALAGCATESGYYDPGRSAGAGALGGAATGAALGAIIGAATGSPATGAWVGAAAGGLVGGVGGYLYAEHRNSERRSAQAAAQSYNYSPSQGSVVDINQVYVNPTQARPGQSVSLGMDYTILTPNNAPVTSTLYREIRVGGTTLGQPYQTTVTNANGTFSDQVNYSLPNNAQPGNYTVVSRVMNQYGSAEKTSYFTVN